MYNLGIDLDGVLADHVTHLIETLKKINLLPKNYVNSDIISWGSSLGGYNFKKIFEKFLNNKKFITTIPTISGSIQALSKIIQKYHVNIITARPVRTAGGTYYWLEKNGYQYNSLSVGYGSERLNLNIDILIDDNPMAINKFSNRGIAIIFDQPWNQRYRLNSNALRMKTWKEITDYLLKTIP